MTLYMKRRNSNIFDPTVIEDPNNKYNEFVKDLFLKEYYGDLMFKMLTSYYHLNGEILNEIRYCPIDVWDMNKKLLELRELLPQEDFLIKKFDEIIKFQWHHLVHYRRGFYNSEELSPFEVIMAASHDDICHIIVVNIGLVSETELYIYYGSFRVESSKRTISSTLAQIDSYLMLKLYGY